MVGVCYRLQGEEVDAAFFKQLDSVSKQRDLVVKGDFNFPDAYWETNMLNI